MAHTGAAIDTRAWGLLGVLGSQTLYAGGLGRVIKRWVWTRMSLGGGGESHPGQSPTSSVSCKHVNCMEGSRPSLSGQPGSLRGRGAPGASWGRAQPSGLRRQRGARQRL